MDPTPTSPADRARFCRVPVVGIVGGIGSGKSSVARWVAERHPVKRLDADELGHRVLVRPEICAQLAAAFGPEILDSTGGIDRRQLATRVFGTRADQVAARRELEGIVHPEIQAEMLRELAEVDDSQYVAVLLDAALLQEAGWPRYCDEVVFIDTPEAERARRVFDQRGWSPEELKSREQSQWPVNRKRAEATRTVLNGGTLSQAGTELGNFIEKLINPTTQ